MPRVLLCIILPRDANFDVADMVKGSKFPSSKDLYYTKFVGPVKGFEQKIKICIIAFVLLGQVWCNSLSNSCLNIAEHPKYSDIDLQCIGVKICARLIT